MKEPADRRRAPRVEAQLALTIAVPERDLEASTRNLSSTGASCEVSRDVPVMTRVALTIALPERRIQCEGVVVRSESVPMTPTAPQHFRLGIFFTRMGPRDKQRIARFVAERLSAPMAPPRATQRDDPPPELRRPAFNVLGFVTCAMTLSGLLGCQASFVVSRGQATRVLVDALGRSAQPEQHYTFRWLRRRVADVSSHQRLDGLVVDFHGRRIEVLRQQDGDHLLRLPIADVSATPPAPVSKDTLKITPQDLPTMQAVVRRYHFEPQLIADAIGEPQVVVYAPVPTRVSVIHAPAGQGLCIEVERTMGQPADASSMSTFEHSRGSDR